MPHRCVANVLLKYFASLGCVPIPPLTRSPTARHNPTHIGAWPKNCSWRERRVLWLELGWVKISTSIHGDHPLQCQGLADVAAFGVARKATLCGVGSGCGCVRVWILKRNNQLTDEFSTNFLTFLAHFFRLQQQFRPAHKFINPTNFKHLICFISSLF